MSSLVKSVGTIGGLTLLSRVFGFARDMLLARVLGAGLAADAFQLAFTLPNTFRRLFAEGAFSVAFVPMYSRALHGSEGDGEAAAARFADDVLSVFLWTLLVFSGVMIAAMPGIVWVLARDFGSVPGKFELAVFLSRVTFPYLALISLVAMLSGLLNARSRFAPGAFAPVLLNIVLIGGIITGWWLRGDSHDDRIVAIALAVSVSLAGVVQLAYLWWAVRRAGLRLHLRLPRLTPEVRRGHLSDQPVRRHLLRHLAAAGVADIAQARRPAQPVAARHRRHRARHRDPADAVAPYSQRRRRRGAAAAEQCL